jgi:hypothetical protein
MEVKKNLQAYLRLSMREFFFLLLVFISGTAKSQQAVVPLNQQWMFEIDAKIVQNRGFVLDRSLMNYEADTVLANVIASSKDAVAYMPVHTSMRPWIEQGHPMRKNILLQNSKRDHLIFHTEDRWPKWFLDYHSKNSLVNVERPAKNGEPVFHLYIDPLLNLEPLYIFNDGEDPGHRRSYYNTRGITARGDIGKKISFETTFYENQCLAPYYIQKFAHATQVFPGQGRWKIFKASGFDYAMSMGYISYSPFRNFNIQAGTGKHFVGDGYRSLLLSDNAFPYPFARLTGWFGPNKMFQYTTIYASLMNLNSVAPIPPGTERLYQKKAASFYQLSANIGRIAEVTLFQGLIWSAADADNKQCIQLAYVNPLIFSSIPFYGMHDKHNFLVGATFHLDLLKTIRVYGQVVADDFGKKGLSTNKKGFQIGVNYYNVAHIKHFHLQFEFNAVNPYTYSARDSAQSYTHYNQPLAHPYGANFYEMIIAGKYKIGDFYADVHFSEATVGADSAGFDFGQNVFASENLAQQTPVAYNNKLGQGRSTTVSYFDVSLGYMISYASNLNICIGFTDRNVQSNATNDHTNLVYIAVRTSLTNNYLDFFR